MVKRDTKKRKNKKDKIRIWILYSLIYAFFYSVLSGTLTHYFNTVSLGMGLFMDVPGFFVMIGLSGWILLTFIVFKGKNIKKI